jgi:radical SAM superfamily enzyme YgiQ (UPF0313 family)
MRVTFVALGCEQLGVSELSAITGREGHAVGVAFSASLFHDRYNLSVPWLAPRFDDRKQVIDAIVRQRPDVLAFSALTDTYRWMLGVAAEANELLPSVTTVFGGVHPSAVPDRVLARPEVDYVCVGEGDVALPSSLRAIGRGGPSGPIPNARFRAPDGAIARGPQHGFVQDLDALPFLDKELWEDHIRVGDFYLTMASRGCPYRCTFCFNDFFANLPDERRGKYVRQRSVDHVMRELLLAKRRYRLRFVDFEDDVFTVDKRWVRAFLERYRREIGVPFHCLTHPRYMDEEVARALAEAGCTSVQMGIQSADDEYKYGTVKRHEKTERAESALEAMHKYRLRVKCDHMFGLPGEPAGAQETARQLYAKHPPYRIQTYWTNLLPGTELVDQTLAAGLVTREQVDRLEEGFDFDFFRESNLGRDPSRMRVFKSYETLFKLLPVLPRWLRGRLTADAFSRLPASLCFALGFVVDASYGLFSRNPHRVSYARHYLHHLRRFALRRIGIEIGPATRRRPPPRALPAHGPPPPGSAAAPGSMASGLLPRR